MTAKNDKTTAAATDGSSSDESEGIAGSNPEFCEAEERLESSLAGLENGDYQGMADAIAAAGPEMMALRTARRG